MSVHDVRCMVSGISLLGAQTALILLSRSPEASAWQLAGLPLWGVYLGTGTLEEVNHGANAELLLEAFAEAAAANELRIDWEQLGMAAFPFDCIEDILMLLACARIHAPEAVIWGQEVVSYALVEAHFGAALMSREPVGLSDLKIEELPDVVFAKAACGQRIYSRLSARSLKQKCQFGLSFLGLAAFAEQLEDQQIEPAGPFFVAEPGQKERWLAAALETFAEAPDIVEALEEYAASEREEEDVESLED